MKLKGGFVTNSSSCSFTFITKSRNRIDFYKTLLEIKNEFELEDCEGNKIDVWDLLRLFDERIRNDFGNNPDMWIKPGFSDLDNLIKAVEDELSHEQFHLEEENKKREPEESYGHYHEQNIDRYQKLLKDFLQYKVNGFKYYYDISFGDNHGDVRGSIGEAMRSFFNTDKDHHYENLIIMTTPT